MIKTDVLQKTIDYALRAKIVQLKKKVDLLYQKIGRMIETV